MSFLPHVVLLTLSLFAIASPTLALIPPGGVHDVSDWESIPDIKDVATFALSEHNQKNGLTEEEGLSFEKIVSVKRQVVSGLIYYITLQAKEGSEHKLYEVKVWLKPWLNFKSLEKITFLKKIVPTADFGSFSRGSMHSTDKNLQEVSSDDPDIQVVVKKAIELLQQQSNSLNPYELLEVSSASKQLLEMNGETSFQLLMKLKRGTNFDNVKVEIHKKEGGRWLLKQAVFS